MCFLFLISVSQSFGKETLGNDDRRYKTGSFGLCSSISWPKIQMPDIKLLSGVDSKYLLNNLYSELNSGYDALFDL